MIFLASCSGVQEHEVSESAHDWVLNTRSTEDCEPMGDSCNDPTVETSTVNNGNLPCQASVSMLVTICARDVNFEEVEIVPSDPDCVFDLDDIEEAYNVFIQFFFDDLVDRGVVPECPSPNTTMHSNYIKQSCVQQCQGLGPVGGPFPIILVPCFSGATGCCIERTRWCAVDGRAINIGEDTRTIQGNCSNSQTVECIPGDPGSAVCIPDRCEQ